MAELTIEQIKQAILTKWGVTITSEKVLQFVLERLKDHANELFPKIPSGQQWQEFTAQEKADYKALMEKNGLDGEAEIKRMLPVDPKLPNRNTWRRIS